MSNANGEMRKEAPCPCPFLSCRAFDYPIETSPGGSAKKENIRVGNDKRKKNTKPLMIEESEERRRFEDVQEKGKGKRDRNKEREMQNL
jgi:hypothetical protein